MAWNESLAIELPRFWIKPEKVVSFLPPYYGDVVRGYVDWMQQPHASLEGLSWGDNLNFIYRPLNPSIRKKEKKYPTTYFVYEGIYTLFAGLVTGAIPPIGQICEEEARYLKYMMQVNIAEVMKAICELGTGRISFDQVHDQGNKTYRLLPPRQYYQAGHPEMRTFTGKESSLIMSQFKPDKVSFNLEFGELDSARCYPGEIDGIRTSYVTDIRLDRARSGSNERRLMCVTGTL